MEVQELQMWQERQAQQVQKFATDLAALLEHADPDVRKEAAAALGALGDSASSHDTARHGAQLHHSDWRVQLASAEALGKGGSSGFQHCDDLIALLDHSEARVQCAAVRALGQISAQAQVDYDDATQAGDEKGMYDAAVRRNNMHKIAANVIQFIDSKDQDIREASHWALQQLGGHAVQRLAQSVTESHDLQDKVAAARVLHTLDGTDEEQDFQCYCIMLKHGSSVDRRGAALNLGKMGHGIPDLAIAIEDESPRVRCAAAEALGTIGPSVIEPLEKMKSMKTFAGLLSDHDHRVRSAAAESIAKVGGNELAAAAADIVQTGNAGARQAAARALGAMGDVAIVHEAERLNAVLEHEDPYQRCEAVTRLGALGAEVASLVDWDELPVNCGRPWFELPKRCGTYDRWEEFVGCITDRLLDDNVLVRCAACHALGQMGRLAVGRGAELVRLLRDNEMAARDAAEAALVKLSSIDDSVGVYLSSALDDPDQETRRAAFRAIGAMGEEGKHYETARQAAQLCHDGDPGRRCSAAEALGKLGNAALGHSQDLANALKDTDPAVRCAAVKALAGLGRGALPHIPDIAACLKDEDLRMRQATTEVLEHLGQFGDAAGCHTAELLKHPDDTVQHTSAKVLEALGPAASSYEASRFSTELRNSDWRVRLAVAQAIAKAGPEAALRHADALADLCADNEPGVQTAAAQAIGVAGKAAYKYVPIVSALLHSSNLRVRTAAAEALQNIGLGHAQIVANADDGDLLSLSETLGKLQAATVR
eukprot:gnl/MRDRNA2_/MRDRNA2_139771_c0_seq1.p1 gnl/MRDRNA2_/MRDRNA2_139771_c0~~gnl/MRDRNA2_/MRDRNA2_139771_c0_seq1.p1  ORF type:complete len:767 (+),score=206.54 gnl/MRDRNA2_/MRDRNA2_139771_c0_seq1:391-2691(+)